MQQTSKMKNLTWIFPLMTIPLMFLEGLKIKNQCGILVVLNINSDVESVKVLITSQCSKA